MGEAVLLKRIVSYASSSSVGFAMAALRRGIHNLNMGSGSSAASMSSRSLSFAHALGMHNNEIITRNNGNNEINCRWSSSGLRMFVSNKNSHVITKEVGKHSIGKDYRFDFTKGGSILTNSQGPLVGGRGRKGGGEVVPTKLVVVTTDGPPELALESSFGQVSGDLDQESEDASGDSSCPRGTYQSPQSAVYGFTQPTATISEVEVELMAELEDALGFPLSQAPQSPAPKPLVIVISGPSGVGKDAVIKKLQHSRSDVHFVVTATTRPMRPGEVDGVDYYFMSKSEFQEMIENHELLEHAIVYGDYKGIPKQQVREFMSQGMDVVLRVDVQGAATVRSILGSEAIFIFLVAESEMALVKRLIERKTETMDKMLVRVATAREELTRMEEFDYVVVNQEGCLDRTVSLIGSIIDAEKARVKPKAAEF